MQSNSHSEYYWRGYKLLTQEGSTREVREVCLEAIKELEKAVKEEPDFHEAHGLLGMAYHQIANLNSKLKRSDYSEDQTKIIVAEMINYYKNALTHYELASKFSPDEIAQAKYLYYMASMFKDVNKLKDAIKCLRMAIKLCPEDNKLYVNLGGYLFESGEKDESIKVLRYAINRGSTSAQKLLDQILEKLRES